MSAMIILEDGRAWLARNIAVQAVHHAVAEELPETDEGKALSNWLKNDDVLNALLDLDVRELTPSNRSMYLEAVESAFQTIKAGGCPVGCEFERWQSWISRLGDLVKMIHSVSRREPAEAFNPHLPGTTFPPDGGKVGPGW